MDDSIFSLFGVSFQEQEEACEPTNEHDVQRDAVTAAASSSSWTSSSAHALSLSSVAVREVGLGETIRTKRTAQGLPKLGNVDFFEAKETQSPSDDDDDDNDGDDDETEEKKRIRRERNRMAATRSRGKKKERVDKLVKEIDKLESDNYQLRTELRKLDQEKKRLSLTLQIHEMKCPRRVTTVADRKHSDDRGSCGGTVILP